MTIEELKTECEMYQTELETVISTDINAAIERGVNIAAYHARIGLMLAEAKLLARKKKSSEISEVVISIAKQNYLSSKAQNALVDSIASEELFYVDWLDRLNSMCVHQLDLIRSIISKEKEEMKYQNFNG
jgi:hypothetical protein